MENRRSLPEYLKQLRKSRGYKQKELASWLHISRQTYSHYETGRIKPSITILYYLAQIYGISVDNILEYMEVGGMDLQMKEEVKTDGVKEDKNFSEYEFFSCLYSLNEKNRGEVFSIMWNMIQAKKQEEMKLRETQKGRI